jgi:DnaK suppressor protein
MKKTDLAKFKKVLEEQLVELQKDASVKLVEANSNNSALPDVNDQASFETERNFELRIKDRERKLISKYQKVLRKIDDGTYGVCESCGGEIGVKRLQARPVTTLCINCKSEMEAEERRQENLMQHGGRSIKGSTGGSAPFV